MAIQKLPSGKYQARLEGPDAKLLTKAFVDRLEAEAQLLAWKKAKREGRLTSLDVRTISLDAYFLQWFKDVQAATEKASDSGWRKNQLQIYSDFISPLIGKCRLNDIRPNRVQQVLVKMAEAGKAPQTRVHAFNLLRKMYRDAIETYEYATFNPALTKLKPRVPQKEARHLNQEQAVRLLAYCRNRKYGIAIWLQLYLGLRLSEVQGLRWEDIDFESRTLCVRRVFVRKTECFRDVPKGGKQRHQSLPPELWERLCEEKISASTEYVAVSQLGTTLSYDNYLPTLGKYCCELGIPHIGTHGLRHTTAELYMRKGATRDDVRVLLGHSSPKTTERYLHGKLDNVAGLAKIISLLGYKTTTETDHEDSTEGPITAN